MTRRRSKSRATPETFAAESSGARIVAEDGPFNNPFAAVLGVIKTRLRRQVREPVAGGATASVSRSSTETNAWSRKQEQGARERPTALGAVLQGVVEIDHSADRVPRRERPGFSSIHDARRAELEEMASLAYFDIRYSEQYIRGCSEGVSNETLRKLERGEFAVRGHLDLHGMVVEDAERAVDRFLSDSQRRGIRCVLVITGKGRNSAGGAGVLREKIPQWLARGPSSRRVLAFVTARQCDGGEGALYVLLRRYSRRKSRINVVTGGVGEC